MQALEAYLNAAKGILNSLPSRKSDAWWGKECLEWREAMGLLAEPSAEARAQLDTLALHGRPTDVRSTLSVLIRTLACVLECMRSTPLLDGAQYAGAAAAPRQQTGQANAASHITPAQPGPSSTNAKSDTLRNLTEKYLLVQNAICALVSMVYSCVHGVPPSSLASAQAKCRQQPHSEVIDVMIETGALQHLADVLQHVAGGAMLPLPSPPAADASQSNRDSPASRYSEVQAVCVAAAAQNCVHAALFIYVCSGILVNRVPVESKGTAPPCAGSSRKGAPPNTPIDVSAGLRSRLIRALADSRLVEVLCFVLMSADPLIVRRLPTTAGGLLRAATYVLHAIPPLMVASQETPVVANTRNASASVNGRPAGNSSGSSNASGTPSRPPPGALACSPDEIHGPSVWHFSTAALQLFIDATNGDRAAALGSVGLPGAAAAPRAAAAPTCRDSSGKLPDAANGEAASSGVRRSSHASSTASITSEGGSLLSELFGAMKLPAQVSLTLPARATPGLGDDVHSETVGQLLSQPWFAVLNLWDDAARSGQLLARVPAGELAAMCAGVGRGLARASASAQCGEDEVMCVIYATNRVDNTVSSILETASWQQGSSGGGSGGDAALEPPCMGFLLASVWCMRVLARCGVAPKACSMDVVALCVQAHLVTMAHVMADAGWRVLPADRRCAFAQQLVYGELALLRTLDSAVRLVAAHSPVETWEQALAGAARACVWLREQLLPEPPTVPMPLQLHSEWDAGVLVTAAKLAHTAMAELGSHMLLGLMRSNDAATAPRHAPNAEADILVLLQAVGERARVAAAVAKVLYAATRLYFAAPACSSLRLPADVGVPLLALCLESAADLSSTCTYVAQTVLDTAARRARAGQPLQLPLDYVMAASMSACAASTLFAEASRQLAAQHHPLLEATFSTVRPFGLIALQLQASAGGMPDAPSQMGSTVRLLLAVAGMPTGTEGAAVRAWLQGKPARQGPGRQQQRRRRPQGRNGPASDGRGNGQADVGDGSSDDPYAWDCRVWAEVVETPQQLLDMVTAASQERVLVVDEFQELSAVARRSLAMLRPVVAAAPAARSDEELVRLVRRVLDAGGQAPLWPAAGDAAPAGAGMGPTHAAAQRPRAAAAAAPAAASGGAASSGTFGESGGAGAGAGALPALAGWWCRNPRCSNLRGPAEAALPMHRCRGCLAVRYCNAECQQAHWKGGHAAECRRQSSQAM